MNNMTSKIQWWWGWDSSGMEKMLENMALKGWELYQMDWIGIRFHFQKGEKKKVRYCADYQVDVGDDYFDIYKDAGWSIKWTGANGWYLWMKPYEEERPEIFTDTASLIERNNRLIQVLKPMFVILLILFVILVSANMKALRPLIFLYVAIISLYSYLFFQVAKYNKKLKDNIRE